MDVKGVVEAVAAIKGFSDRRLAAALATSLTRTASDIAKGERDAMVRVLDRPRPYTLGGVGLKPASASDLVAEVFLKTDGASGRGAGKYLRPLIDGAQRRMQGWEKKLEGAGVLPAGWRAVPGAGARLDAQGNLDRRQLRQIFDQLRLLMGTGPRSRAELAKRRSAAARAGGAFFVLEPGKAKAAPGIYSREGRSITPVIVFVTRSQYRRLFDFYGEAQRVAERRLQQNVARAIDESVGRLLAKRGAA